MAWIFNPFTGTLDQAGSGGGGTGHTIQEDAVSLTARTNLNFSTGITATDNAGTNSSDITVTKSGIGLGNVDNTSDATKNAAVATLTNKTIDADGAGNSITNIENADIKAAAAIAVNKLAAVTVSRALVSDGSGFVSAATTTSTEIGYVNGVTSAIQTQLDAKLATSAYDDATGAETTTGTSTAKYVSPDGLAGSDYGKRIATILVSDPLGSAITTGDGKAGFRIPSAMTGYNLVAVGMNVTTVSSSGIPTIQLRRSRRTNATTRGVADMLTTKLTVDASEFESADAATAAVIDTANDDVVTGDVIFVDIDVAGTGAKGLIVEMQFQLP